MHMEHNRQQMTMSEELGRVASLMAQNDKLRLRLEAALNSSANYKVLILMP